jgi:hypothetical protein
MLLLIHLVRLDENLPFRLRLHKRLSIDKYL